MFLRGKPLQKDFQNQRRSHGIDRFLALLAEHAVFRQNPVRIDGRPAFVNKRDRQTGARLEQRCKPAAFFPLQADGAVHIDRQADGNGGDVFFMEQGGKLFWTTSSYMLDSYIDSAVSGGNSNLFLNVLNWMGGQEESISIRAKSLDTTGLTVTQAESTLWSIVMIGLIPLALVAIGIVIWIRRKRR